MVELYQKLNSQTYRLSPVEVTAWIGKGRCPENQIGFIGADPDIAGDTGPTNSAKFFSKEVNTATPRNL